MKLKNLFLCYFGILTGTILANFCLNDVRFLFQQMNVQEPSDIVLLMVRRSIEVILLVYIGMVTNRRIWDGLIDFLSGAALGILISVKTMLEGLFPTILYFFLALVIVTLYNIVLKLTMAESQDKQEFPYPKLHNSLINKLIVVAIIFVNAFLEMFAIKIF